MAITGPGRIRWNQGALTALLRGPQGDVAKDLARRAIRVERQAKHLCPVDTGRLRASITWAMESDARGLLAIVGTNVVYAPFVEFGTSRMAAQPFLRPALGAAR